VAGGSGKGDSGLVTDHLRAHHSECLSLSGIHLTGHDGGTGLIDGDQNLTDATPRARRQIADVIGNLFGWVSGWVSE
jgi:hypothetical protein